MNTWDIRLRALPDIPHIQAGDDLPGLIHTAQDDDGKELLDDVLVIAQKVVSKAEDRTVRLSTVTPTQRGEQLAGLTGRDARLCQLYLDETVAVLQIIGRHVMTLDARGLVDTAGGVDSSNAGIYAEGWACLLPVDPDASARAIRDRLRELTGATVAVIISDSHSQPYRQGSHGAAIGIATVEQPPAGDKDLYGNLYWGNLYWGDINRVDELAAAASALMGQSGAAIPVVLVRGANYTPDEKAKKPTCGTYWSTCPQRTVTSFPGPRCNRRIREPRRHQDWCAVRPRAGRRGPDALSSVALSNAGLAAKLPNSTPVLAPYSRPEADSSEPKGPPCRTYPRVSRSRP